MFVTLFRCWADVSLPDGMDGHQLVISIAYYNNNLALQLYCNGSSTCYLEEVMMVPKNLLLRIQGGGARAPPCTCLRAPMV